VLQSVEPGAEDRPRPGRAGLTRTARTGSAVARRGAADRPRRGQAESAEQAGPGRCAPLAHHADATEQRPRRGTRPPPEVPRVRPQWPAAGGAEACAAELADLVVLEVTMPAMDGLTACRSLRASHPQASHVHRGAHSPRVTPARAARRPSRRPSFPSRATTCCASTASANCDPSTPTRRRTTPGSSGWTPRWRPSGEAVGSTGTGRGRGSVG